MIVYQYLFLIYQEVEDQKLSEPKISEDPLDQCFHEADTPGKLFHNSGTLEL